MKKTSRAVLAGLLGLAVLTASGCGTKQAVSTVVQQGVETTSAGPNNVVPANDAQNAVDNLNNSVDQEQQQAQGLGQ